MVWHPKLIQANIALYAGSYAEARRLLDEYRTHEGIVREQGALVLWLDAQAQEDHEERMRRLQILVMQSAADNPYVQMAQRILREEADHEAQMRAARSTAVLPGLKAWHGVTVAMAAAALLFIVITLNKPVSISDIPVTPLITPSAVIGTPLDTSRPLDPSLHTGRYPQGILQILRFEDASQRVFNPDTNTAVTAVAGARFYALQIGFECRSGVCDQPPEANLTLSIDTDTRIAPRGDVVIIGENRLLPVALGRIATGWIVFEIPVISDVQALIVTARDNQAFEPITIPVQETP